jgi:adenosylcobinamide-GDP ribazoletransferase
MVTAMYHGKPAREDGLGRLFLDNIKAGTVLSSSVVTVLVCILVTVLNFGRASAVNAVALSAVLLASCSLFSFLSAKFCMRRFGGLTGDNFGATGEVSEILFLMVVLLWFRESI